MNALIDTNILVDYAQELPDAARELNRYGRLHVSRITWIEFLAGVRDSEEDEVRRGMLAAFEILELDGPVSDETTLIRRKSRLKLPDAIILATARVHGLLLVTRNHRDFPRREPEIRIPY